MRPLALLVDEVDQQSHVVNRCLRQDAVTQVEDMPRPAVSLLQHLSCALA